MDYFYGRMISDVLISLFKNRAIIFETYKFFRKGDMKIEILKFLTIRDGD